MNIYQKKYYGEQKKLLAMGVSGMKRSWSDIINDKLANIKVNTEEVFHNNQPTTKEQYYYRNLFRENYPRRSNLIPYFWMPKYVEANDSSARKLDIYKEK